MSKKKFIAISFCILITILFNVYVFTNISIGTIKEQQVSLNVEMSSDLNDVYQVYYSEDGVFSEDKASSVAYNKAGKKDNLKYFVGVSDYLRIDFGNNPAVHEVYNISYKCLFKEIDIDLNLIKESTLTNGIVRIEQSGDKIIITTDGNDPYIAISLDSEMIEKELNDHLKGLSLFVNILICLIVDAMVLVGLKYIKKFVTLPIELYHNKGLIWNLSKNDFKTKYVGSYLGIIWAFVQPVITVIVYWFVFEIGLRAGRMCNYPFILWLMAGLLPWFFFSEALSGGTNALLEYHYLVKKVVFKISILPIVKVMSSIFVHVFFVAFVMILCWCYGYHPDLYSLQLIYYILCTFVLVLGITYMTSAVIGFFRDLSQIINVILQVGMWVTPIMWDPVAVLSPELQVIFKLNPMYYIVDGFRNALLDKIWFWDKPIWTCYFWIVVLATFGIGVTVFKKLRVHFADVL